MAVNVRAAFAEQVVSNWLGIRLQMMATLVITFIALVAVVQKHLTVLHGSEPQPFASNNSKILEAVSAIKELLCVSLKRFVDSLPSPLVSLPGDFLWWKHVFSQRDLLEGLLPGFVANFGGPLTSARRILLMAAGPGGAGLIGLGLSYALPIVELLNGLLATFTETEKEMVAVERVQQVHGG